VASSDPADDPIIDPNFLAHPFDIHVMVAAINSMKQFLSAPAWQDYVLGPWGSLANATTTTELESYVRQNAGTEWHGMPNQVLR
jgi:hypothetical protein